MKTIYKEYIKTFLSNYTTINTRRAYEKDLYGFFEFLKYIKINTIEKIPLKHLTAYRDSLLSQFAPKTVCRKFSGINAFFQYCLSEGIVKHNPILALKLPKAITLKPTQALTNKEVRALLRAPDSFSFYGNLHKMILASLLTLGLRRSELAKIKLKDIYETRDGSVLKIYGKGSKLREIPITIQMRKIIKEYLTNYTALTGKKLTGNDYLLQSKACEKNKKPYNDASINRVVVDNCKKLGITKEISAHSLRATAISFLLELGESPRNIADFVGHSNINTTILYDKKRDNLKNSSAYKVDYTKF